MLAFLSGRPNNRPHVSVLDPDAMTTAVTKASNDPSCGANERATCVGPERESLNIMDVIKHGLSRPDEQCLARNEVVERRLPQAVEVELLRMVERELPQEVDTVESSIPYLDANPTSR
ncbi:hypothetical protein PC116_g9711 [Phytophthora cactorum]|uniref:Uncharacterized protein n=1 Tax=Phytophthora cactorum TaxID=29920 RepID=A0A8T1ATF5_9STRA|nr:hypothetical protein PC114_g25647 [Phytophthora cactorum]KAG2886439.1 hypothetical protein PC117_g25377 [Phytophthora cactorum]KAG2966315.1 hypothetical protein PC119_g24741 [Phytophthora cactorum]KAG3156678.1 hypothetical protein C6341_g14988 [Phytophthora cactorum]KAG4242392.1 hypothetical protein PC116_g9711 [Phytophthora cactorum]